LETFGYAYDRVALDKFIIKGMIANPRENIFDQPREFRGHDTKPKREFTSLTGILWLRELSPSNNRFPSAALAEIAAGY
jgi:hypothetical protein